MSSNEHDENQDLNLRSAADTLTKGGILIREPCDVCNGVQVKFKDQLKCVNCGKITDEHQPTIMSKLDKTDESDEITADASSDRHFNLKLQNIAVTSIERRILELASDIKNNNSIFDELEKARLIDTYLSILDRFGKLLHRK
jgi:uncharacterized Zn finger protein (UPF0148 family)